MYRKTARLIILPLLYARNLFIAIGGYAGGIILEGLHYIIPLLFLTICSVPIVLIVIGGDTAYVGYLLALVLLSIGGCIIYAGIAMAAAFAESAKPITDVSRYQEVSIRLFGPDSEYLHHFPSEIPSDARNIQMYFLHGFQGFIFRLQMQLPRERIEEIQLQFRPTAKFKYIPGSEHNSISVEYKSDGMPSLGSYRETLSYGSEIGDRPLLGNYEILVLDADPSPPSSHPLSYGVAIDSSTSEVIYWITKG